MAEMIAGEGTLPGFFAAHPRAAVAFSGGVDSSYLLYAAARWGERTKAFYVRTPFQPRFEYDDACRLARELGVPMITIPLDTLAREEIACNPSDRCYHCKRAIFTAIAQTAGEDGFTLILDGTNASDDPADRPGMRALRELSVRSPLRECGITKGEVRRLSREAGLFTWDKPAYACLATRIPAGTPITRQMLDRTEWGEDHLRELGFTDFRIRLEGQTGKIQLPENQMGKLLERRKEILDTLRQRYGCVTLDLEARQHE